jgi:hypothetical protein
MAVRVAERQDVAALRALYAASVEAVAPADDRPKQVARRPLVDRSGTGELSAVEVALA